MTGNVIEDNVLISDYQVIEYANFTDLTVLNNQYLGSPLAEHGWMYNSDSTHTESGNTEINPQNYMPAAPTGLTVTRFLDSYLIQWNENNESQTYEYIVYRDGSRIQKPEGGDVTTRGGTFFVDIDAADSGTHTYTISARNLNGQEGSQSASVSTADAPYGWNGWVPPTDPEGDTSYCDDGSCDAGETTSSCPADCGSDDTDSTNPTISITGPTSASTYTSSSATISLSGTASDNVGVTSVTCTAGCGGQSVTGTTSWSVSNISLSEGDNVITVQASDAVGNQQTDTITVSYSSGSSATNLALNVPATASISSFDTTPGDANDGDWHNGWAASGTAWIEFNLGGIYSVNEILVGPYSGTSDIFYTNAWNVQYRTTTTGSWQDFNGVTKTAGAGTLVGSGISVTNGNPGTTVADAADASYMNYIFTVTPVNARYIRFIVTEGDADGDSNLTELEVYGT